MVMTRGVQDVSRIYVHLGTLRNKYGAGIQRTELIMRPTVGSKIAIRSPDTEGEIRQ